MNCGCPFSDFPKKYLYYVKNNEETIQVFLSESQHRKLQKVLKEYPNTTLSIKE